MTLEPKGPSEPVRLSLWDFGRQQTYHGEIDCLDYLQNPDAFPCPDCMIERTPEVRTLSLVTELRDDLASNPADIPITREQMAGSCQKGQ